MFDKPLADAKVETMRIDIPASSKAPAIQVFAVCPIDGVDLLAACGDGNVHVLSSLQHKSVQRVAAHKAAVTHIAVFEENGIRKIVTGSQDTLVKVWNLQTAQCEYTVIMHDQPITALTTTDDARVISAAKRDGTAVVHKGHPECEFRLTGHADSITSIAIHPDSRAVTASDDKTAKVWSLGAHGAAGTCLLTLTGHKSAIRAVSTIAELVVTASEDTNVRVWNIDKGSCDAILEGHTNWIRCLAVRQIGERIMVATGGLDSLVCVWCCSGGKWEPTANQLPHKAEVLAIAITPDDVVISGSQDGSIRTWNSQSAPEDAQVFTAESGGHQDWVRHICYDDKAGIASAAGFDGAVTLWW